MDRKWEPAITLLRKAVLIQPANADPYFHLAQAYQATEKYTDAIEALRKSIALNPSLDHNDYQVTNAHYRLGQSLLKTARMTRRRKNCSWPPNLNRNLSSRTKRRANSTSMPSAFAIRTAKFRNGRRRRDC